MKVAVFSAKQYDEHFLSAANAGKHELHFLEPRLTAETAILADGADAVCGFVNDHFSDEVLGLLAGQGVRFVALRCAGYNNVDLEAAKRHGIAIARVPAYSPYAVAEHTVGLILALNRKLHRAYNRVREGNFSLDGLLGFDLHGVTAGIVGTGKIGTVVMRILAGFGCRLLAHDIAENPICIELGAKYVAMEQLLAESHIITLHCPLTQDNYHLIDTAALEKMRDGVMLINTSRGGLLETRSVLEAVKSGKIGALGLDVYEEEKDLFFEDRSSKVIADDVFMRLVTFPNVLITGHQGFFTRNALENIASTTITNVTEFQTSGFCSNVVE